MFDLHEALRYVVENEGSDLHVKVPARPTARFRGQLEPLPQYTEPLTPPETERVVREMLAAYPDKVHYHHSVLRDRGDRSPGDALADAVRRNPQGKVIFATRSPQRIRENLARLR